LLRDEKYQNRSNGITSYFVADKPITESMFTKKLALHNSIGKNFSPFSLPPELKNFKFNF
jgi:hypothetical protein